MPAGAPAGGGGGGGAGGGGQRSWGVGEVGAGSGGAHPGQLLAPPRPGLAFGAMPLASSGEDAGDAEPVGEVVAVGVGERAGSPAAVVGAGQAGLVQPVEVVVDRRVA